MARWSNPTDIVLITFSSAPAAFSTSVSIRSVSKHNMPSTPATPFRSSARGTGSSDSHTDTSNAPAFDRTRMPSCGILLVTNTFIGRGAPCILLLNKSKILYKMFHKTKGTSFDPKESHLNRH
uniref:Uncharacterized protein n=1 Tax=Anguilla anguilla TaxID=7936 RepID=A0A0E9Q136_ANGAN